VLGKNIAFKKSCTLPEVPALNEADLNSGKYSLEIILSPSKEVSPDTFIELILLSNDAESTWYDAVVNNPVVSAEEAVIFNLATWAEADKADNSLSVAKLVSNDELNV